MHQVNFFKAAVHVFRLTRHFGSKFSAIFIQVYMFSNMFTHIQRHSLTLKEKTSSPSYELLCLRICVHRLHYLFMIAVITYQWNDI